MNSAMTTLYLVYRRMLYMNTSICLVLLWHVLSLRKDQQRSHVKKVRLLSVMVLQAKEMTRFVLSLVSKHQLLILRSSLLGEANFGNSIPVNQRLNIVRLMVLIFHLLQTAATAVIETYGISVMKVLNQKILQMLQITIIFLFLEHTLRKLLMKQKKLQ